MRRIDQIIVHCAATPDDSSFGIEDVDSWHKERGFAREASNVSAFNPKLPHVGYHFVITYDGVVHSGRGLNEVGAHARGHNRHSVGICLMGTSEFTDAQYEALRSLVLSLQDELGELGVVGHHKLNANKTCPNFDVKAFMASARAQAVEPPTKPMWQSRTVIAGVASTVASLALIVGVEINVEEVTTVLTAMATLVSSLSAVYFRAVATDKLV